METTPTTWHRELFQGLWTGSYVSDCGRWIIAEELDENERRTGWLLLEDENPGYSPTLVQDFGLLADAKRAV